MTCMAVNTDIAKPMNSPERIVYKEPLRSFFRLTPTGIFVEGF